MKPKTRFRRGLPQYSAQRRRIDGKRGRRLESRALQAPSSGRRSPNRPARSSILMDFIAQLDRLCAGCRFLSPAMQLNFRWAS